MSISVGDPPSPAHPEPREPDDLDTHRSGDAAMAEAIRETDYDLTHPRSRALAAHLATFGTGTLVNLWRDDKLFAACERLGLGRLPVQPPSWPAGAIEFLEHVAWEAAARFITNSLRKWRADGGASIKTYYVNYSLYEFKRLYVPFCKHEWDRHRHELLREPLDPELTGDPAPDDPERLAIHRRTISEAMAFAEGPQLRTILAMAADGMSQKQIAKQLGISVNTITRRLADYRRTLESNGWANGNGER